MTTPQTAIKTPVSDLIEILSFKNKKENNNANTGTNEKIVCATDTSINETV